MTLIFSIVNRSRYPSSDKPWLTSSTHKARALYWAWSLRPRRNFPLSYISVLALLRLHLQGLSLLTFPIHHCPNPSRSLIVVKFTFIVTLLTWWHPGFIFPMLKVNQRSWMRSIFESFYKREVAGIVLNLAWWGRSAYLKPSPSGFLSESDGYSDEYWPIKSG